MTMELTGLRRAAPATTVRVLPTSPSNAELPRYIHREVAVIAGMSAISVLCLTISQVHFALLNPWLLLVLPFLGFTMLYSLVSLIINVGSRNFDMPAHENLVKTWRPAPYPSVDVMLPICNEGLDVLENAWGHVAVMATYYPGPVRVHVLDDGASPDAERMAADFGFEYKVRPDRGWFKKAGNLRHGYRTSSNEYIAIFDADFCPRADFLDHLLPYLDADPNLGIVQSPQYFRADAQQTLMERGAAAVQELFYRMVQVSRDQRNGAICVGSCAVYRRAALDDIGGTTLIEHSEDVHTGFDLRRAGWGLRYIPVPLATGLCPEDGDSFLTQQYRWCSGSMSLLASRKFWTTRMPLITRLCYLSGFCYYIHTAVFLFVTPAIPLALIIAEPSHVLLDNFVWIVPSTVYALVVFPLWNRIRYGPSALMARYLYSWAHLFAIIDALRGRQRSWQATGSGGAKADTRRVWRAMIGLGSLTSIVWIGGAAVRAHQYGVKNWVFVEFAGCLYLFVLALSLSTRKRRTR
jgi:cellulose synthase (UDP-forming)